MLKKNKKKREEPDKVEAATGNQIKRQRYEKIKRWADYIEKEHRSKCVER